LVVVVYNSNPWFVRPSSSSWLLLLFLPVGCNTIAYPPTVPAVTPSKTIAEICNNNRRVQEKLRVRLVVVVYNSNQWIVRPLSSSWLLLLFLPVECNTITYPPTVPAVTPSKTIAEICNNNRRVQEKLRVRLVVVVYNSNQWIVRPLSLCVVIAVISVVVYEIAPPFSTLFLVDLHQIQTVIVGASPIP
ncbi:hypothetical protein BDB00DRAFT_943879, partial [Zychaea mexicana]|uniref:uncharacterized protein n=1 Tax=Zychaea mexicana TaxID=64656 RepID=UPI0022FF39AA